MDLQNRYIELLSKKKELAKQYSEMMAAFRTEQKIIEAKLKEHMETNQITVLPCSSENVHAVEFRQRHVPPSTFKQSAIELSFRHALHAKLDSDELEDLWLAFVTHLKENNKKLEENFKLIKVQPRKRWKEVLENM